MKYFLNHLTAALTVALLLTSPVAYSDNSSHAAMVDTYYDTYGDDSGKGMIAYTDDKGVTTLHLIGITDNSEKLCGIFGDMTDHITVIAPDRSEAYYNCSL